ncbi:hypothetical protein DFJ74DRAFT_702554 [Hyaloraphidium curvatum]|nr:hypothetical protein DFJ74DRAFT_702554 [Hyaloraphidium curvatum]
MPDPATDTASPPPPEDFNSNEWAAICPESGRPPGALSPAPAAKVPPLPLADLRREIVSRFCAARSQDCRAERGLCPVFVIPDYWRTPWGILGALAILTTLNYALFNILGRISMNVSLLQLSLRVRRRATILALRGLLDKCRLAVASETGPTLPASKLLPDLYIRLHRRLADTWSFRIPFLVASPPLVAFAVSSGGVSLIANIAAGSCVPLWTVFMFLYILCGVITDLVHLSLSNQQIDTIAGLYREAQAEIREMLAVAPRCPADVRHELNGHDALLGSFLGVEGFRARFLGFVVTFGVLRTLLITIFTLGIGLSSLLRGTVFIAVDSVCPTRS